MKKILLFLLILLIVLIALSFLPLFEQCGKRTCFQTNFWGKHFMIVD